MTEEVIETWRQRAAAMVRGRLVGQYLAHDLDGDGALGKDEIEKMPAKDASVAISLLGTSDQDDDGELSWQ